MKQLLQGNIEVLARALLFQAKKHAKRNNTKKLALETFAAFLRFFCVKILVTTDIATCAFLFAKKGIVAQIGNSAIK